MMRRYVLASWLALWAGVASLAMGTRPQLPAGGGVAVRQDLADAGPMHRPSPAWRLVEVARAPSAAAREPFAPFAPGHGTPILWQAVPAAVPGSTGSTPAVAAARLQSPRFPTGPPRVRANA